MTTSEAVGDLRARAEQLVTSAADRAYPVSVGERSALIDALIDDLNAAESAEARLERLEAQQARMQHVLLVLIERVQMR